MSSELLRASLYFRFIKSEHSHHQDVFECGQKALLEALSRVRVDTNVSQSSPQVDNSQKNLKEEKEETAQKDPEPSADLPVELKKLYRKIVVETHPDKLINLKISDKERDKRRQAYIRAIEAFDKKDADILVELAVDLEIETNLPESQISKSLRARGNFLETAIDKIKKSPEWFWVHADEQQKIDVIRQICQRNGWIYITDEKIIETVRFVSGIHPGTKESVKERARKMMQERHRLS